MAIRYLKILLTTFIALLGLIYATQNMVNLDAAYGVISTVAGMEGHNYYTNSLGPAITSPFLIWMTIAIIIGSEYLVGLFAAKGAWDLWQARSGTAETFNKAKQFALLGGGMALFVWFGLFGVIGGAYFQMWQTELGQLSLEGAFQYGGASALATLFIYMKDE